MKRARLPVCLLLALVPSWSLGARADGEFVNVSGIYETLMGMLEQGGQSPVVSAVDLDAVELFDLSRLTPGLHYLYSGRHRNPAAIAKARELVVLIHGVDEPGSNWDTAVRLLAREPGLLVFFFVWTKWNRPHAVEYWIGHDIDALAQAFTGKLSEMEVVAHSAGGLLLLQALCLPDSSRLCAYDASRHYGLKVRFHTVASPLGGYGMSGAEMASPLAGAVTARVGSDVVFYDIQPDIDLTVWYTAYQSDKVLRSQAGRDMRFPQFSGPAPVVKKKSLPDCTHDTSILAGVTRIFGLKPPEQVPGGGPWKLIYQDEGQVTPPKAPARPEDNEWRQVPR
jgi:hypothetical protein